MANALLESLVAAYKRPDPEPYLFDVGQRVRVCRFKYDDGQTPQIWSGAFGHVLRRRTAGLSKEHWYEVDGGNITADFREGELDSRYVRKGTP